jgi:hypothetical protein
MKYIHTKLSSAGLLLVSGYYMESNISSSNPSTIVLSYEELLRELDNEFAESHSDFLNNVPVEVFDLDVPKSNQWCSGEKVEEKTQIGKEKNDKKEEEMKVRSREKMWKLAYEEYTSIASASATSRPELATLLNKISTPSSKNTLSPKVERDAFILLSSFPIIFYRAFTNTYILKLALKYQIDLPFILSESIPFPQAESIPFPTYKIKMVEIMGAHAKRKDVNLDYLRKCRTLTSFSFILFGTIYPRDYFYQKNLYAELLADLPLLEYMIGRRKYITSFIINYQSTRSGPLTDEAFEIFTLLFRTFRHKFDVQKLVHLIRNINTEREEIAIKIYDMAVHTLSGQVKMEDRIKAYPEEVRMDVILKRELSNCYVKYPSLYGAIEKGYTTLLKRLFYFTPDPAFSTSPVQYTYPVPITTSKNIWHHHQEAYPQTMKRTDVISFILTTNNWEVRDILIPVMGDPVGVVAVSMDFGAPLRKRKAPLRKRSEGEQAEDRRFPEKKRLKPNPDQWKDSLKNSLNHIYQIKGVDFFLTFIPSIQLNTEKFSIFRSLLEDSSTADEIRSGMKKCIRHKLSSPNSLKTFMNDFDSITGFDQHIFDLYVDYGWIKRIHVSTFIYTYQQNMYANSLFTPHRSGEKWAKFLYHLITHGYEQEIVARGMHRGITINNAALYMIARYAPNCFKVLCQNSRNRLTPYGSPLFIDYSTINGIIEVYIKKCGDSIPYDVQAQDIHFLQTILEHQHINSRNEVHVKLLSTICGGRESESIILTMVKCLEQNGVAIHSTINNNYNILSIQDTPIPPLLAAIRVGKLEVASYLIESGADISVKVPIHVFRDIISNHYHLETTDIKLGVVELLLLFNSRKVDKIDQLVKLLERKNREKAETDENQEKVEKSPIKDLLKVSVSGIGNAIDLALFLFVHADFKILPYLLSRGITMTSEGGTGTALLRYISRLPWMYLGSHDFEDNMIAGYAQMFLKAGADISRRWLEDDNPRRHAENEKGKTAVDVLERNKDRFPLTLTVLREEMDKYLDSVGHKEE